tara:strand:+ start:590 stop:778 length:189 start_codon:yes stop_codon:yes gene_type:complete
MKNWVVIIYRNKEKSEIFKVLNLDSVKQIAYILNETPTDVSNFYHKLIKPKNLMNYIDIYKK